MEDIAFSDWPGQALDISENNPWLPAYGFQTPSTLLEKEDFLGNPDAEYFLHGGGGGGMSYMYLETIQEETSDDLRSDSDISESRISPVGWLASDSERGSVIRIDIDEVDCESDRETACPAKRRKQENVLTIHTEDDCESLSRSSSLVQFETLEKQCQEISSRSPSIYSQFSFDSLDHQRKNNVSPDSLDRHSDNDNELDYYKSLQIDIPLCKHNKKVAHFTKDASIETDSGDSTGGSDETLEASRSFDNLKSWRSFDSLPVNSTCKREKASTENLSEDSGYSEHLYGLKTKNNSETNLDKPDTAVFPRGINSAQMKNRIDPEYFSINTRSNKLKKSGVDFRAYDGEGFQNFTGNFGTSYHDLSIFDKYETVQEFSRPLFDIFMQKRQSLDPVTKFVNIEKSPECERSSKYNCASISVPNLPQVVANSQTTLAEFVLSSASSFDQNHCVCSVPKDLNFISDSNKEPWSFSSEGTSSVAAKNFDLADISYCSFENFNSSEEIEVKETMSSFKREGSYAEAIKNSSFKREGSYAEAMGHRVDLSDDESSLRFTGKKKQHPKNLMEEFDRQVLRAISETSIQSRSIPSSRVDLTDFSTPKNSNLATTSTPNLAAYYNKHDNIHNSYDERCNSSVNVCRKSSLRNSTSTSGMSDLDDKPAASVSISESISSKGVHFSPIVDELNWQDDRESITTLERESSYSLQSSPERDLTPPPLKPQARLPSPLPGERMFISQPDLNEYNEEFMKQEFEQSLNTFRCDISKSQPEMHKLKRRGSQLLKKDKDGCIIKAYVDGDGCQYKHTHLDVGLDGGVYSKTPTTSLSHVGDSNNKQCVQSLKKPVVGMDGEVKVAPRKEKGKLGGFFSRLASFRFSGRRDAKKKKNSDGVNAKASAKSIPAQKLATKDDYIYIPLKGPGITENNNHQTHAVDAVSRQPPPTHVTTKPPVPRAPPRVVGASVKRDGGGIGQLDSQDRRRRRTIDSGTRPPRPMEPMGLIETDLDTEVTVITDGSAHVKTRSLLNLGAQPAQLHLSAAPREGAHRRPHKSMEFLLDKENLKVVEPPENELQKGERVMSEHQLRVQRSLQKLTLPDWYKQSPLPREGFILKKGRESRWTGTANSKTTSMSSLGGSHQQSPVILSPTPYNQPFVRWSTSKLNSTASSPCASTRSSFNAPRQPNGSISPSSVRSSFSFRQPYLGWRSQERLSRPRTPAERLANTMLQNCPPTHLQQESPEIQSSIKEVTSAIVHYVSTLRPEDSRPNYDSQETVSQRSSSVSPRGSQKFCWLESSFVGTKPLDSPQTPVALSEQQQPASLRLELQNHTDDVIRRSSIGAGGVKPSPGSTTLEDVLDSLLGLPSSARAPSPSLQETVSANTSPKHENQSEQFRRRSEGNEPSSTYQPTRRVSFNSSPILRCRYSRCGRMAMASTPEGSAFKNCHNCSYTYCSRTCRRAHWEKHRKTCLFSRIGTLCRQVIASTKERKDTLLHFSSIARRGYLSLGPGAVKCFFPCPEAAEAFLDNGLQSLGELTYIRWQDLLPNEMGAQMYAELVKMCKAYNPDTKLVLYVSVCVISEAPATGSIKWERQLVSRCAKMRLSRDIPIPENIPESLDTLILTCSPLRESLHSKLRELKENCVNNVQRQLRQRGVSLRRHHPDIYKQLNVYVEGDNARFTPVTVYPKDVTTGKSFMCIIMLEAEDDSLKQVEMAGVKVRTVDVLAQ